MNGIIVCGGSIDDISKLEKYFNNMDLVICVDSGARHLKNSRIIPDILIGDFDSISESDYTSYKNMNVEIIKFPVEKDMTDSELAIELAIERGCKSITIIGATGTRLDHTLANIFLLKKLFDSGIKGLLVDEHNEIELIDKYIELVKEEDMKVSLLPVYGDVIGVTTKGLYYPLVNAHMRFGTTWGVSNEFIEDKASVLVKEGLLLIIKSKD